jgi:hypothetical protein
VGTRDAKERKALAARATYLGSSEHKVGRWWGGLSNVRFKDDGTPTRPKKQKTTICPLASESDRDQATIWIRCAIENGQYKFAEGDKDFPQLVWHKVDGQSWFGRCINSAAGHYKGWPVDEGEIDAYFG